MGRHTPRITVRPAAIIARRFVLGVLGVAAPLAAAAWPYVQMQDASDGLHRLMWLCLVVAATILGLGVVLAAVAIADRWTYPVGRPVVEQDMTDTHERGDCEADEGDDGPTAEEHGALIAPEPADVDAYGGRF